MPIEEPPADSGRLLIFVLPRSLTGWRIECDSFRDQAGKILLLVDYDHEFVGEVAESVGAESLLGPMDILGDDDIDPIINDALLWRRQFAQAMQDPQVRLAAGAWLTQLGECAVLRLRIIRMAQKAVQRIQPAAYAVLGEHPNFPWMGRLLHRTLRQAGVPAVAGQAEAADCASKNLSDWVPLSLRRKFEMPMPAPIPPDPIDPETMVELESFRAAHSLFLSGRPNIVLLMRFRNGARWFHDRCSGHLLRADQYNELYMERLARICAQREWAMTVISYDGPGVVPEGGRPLSELYPDTVRELTRAEFPPGIWLQSREQTNVEAARFAHAVKNASLDQRLKLDGIPVADTLAPYLLEGMATSYARFSSGVGTQWSRAIQALQPTAIAGARLENMPHFLRIASQLGVPSITLRFGMGNDMAIGTLVEDVMIEGCYRPTLNLTWGEYSAQVLRRWGHHVRANGAGRPRNDVFVLEAPHLDGSEIRKRIGVPPGDRVILVGINCRTRFAEETRGRGQGIVSPITFARCISALARLAQHLGSTRVVIKPHESDDMLLLQEITERHGHGLTSVARNVVEGFHNVEILAAADVVIANPSSLLAEAVCSGVPAVLLVTPDVRFFFEPGRIQSCAAFAHLTRDIDELVEVTEKLLTDKGFRCAEIARGRTGVAAFFGAPDGKSSERVAMAIADMVAEHLAGKAVPTVSA